MPDITPKYIEVFGLSLSQSFITAFVATIFFILFLIIYNYIKSRNPKNWFVVIVEVFVEWMLSFFNSIWEWIPRYAMGYVLFVFFYLLWVNMFGLFGDLFALAIPAVYEWFRPVATDIAFNAILAVVWVLASLFYGFQKNWLHFIEKYVPYKWVGLVEEVNSFKTFVLKFFDIIIWLFVWVLEIISEFAKMFSLTLRLFWNIFAWVVLLTLAIWFIPVGFPVFVIAFEFLVSFLQAFVFALLVCVYFKMAESVH